VPVEEVGVGLAPVVARGRVPTEPPLTPREDWFGAVEGSTPVLAPADAFTCAGVDPVAPVVGVGVWVLGVGVGVWVLGVGVGVWVLGVGVGVWSALGLGVAEHAGLGVDLGPCVLPGALLDPGVRCVPFPCS
jgi:hypothetical protein